MRHLLEILPNAVLPDPARETDDPGLALDPPDDEDLIRPQAEEQLLVADGRARRSPLAKHLPWSFSPLDPAMPLPVELQVELDGAVVVRARVEAGFCHQGLEKRCEQVSVAQAFSLVARAAPEAPAPFEIALATAVERLARVRVSERVLRWRRVAIELTRIVDHTSLLLSPQLGLPRRASTALRAVAEQSAALLAGITTGGTFAVAGGLLRDLDDGEAETLGRSIPRLRETLEQVEPEDAFADLGGLGCITRQRALELGCSGPLLRACGVADDVRLTDGWHPVVREAGCTEARLSVRLQECHASLTFVDQEMDKLHGMGGPHLVPLPDLLPPGIATAAVEAPDGELFVLVTSDGSGKPARVRLRPAAIALVGAIPFLLQGESIDEIGAILAGVGLRGSALDR